MDFLEKAQKEAKAEAVKADLRQRREAANIEARRLARVRIEDLMIQKRAEADYFEQMLSEM